MSVELLNLDTPYQFLPGNLQQQLDTVDRYVISTLESRGVKPTVTTAAAFLEEMRFDMGIEEDASPSAKLEAISAYCANMLKIDGLDDVKRQLKTKLRQMRNRRAMDNEVLKTIGKRIL